MNQKDIDDAQKTVDKLTEDLKENHEKTKGGKFDTEEEAKLEVKANWTEYTWGKRSLKVEGGYTRVQIGPSDTVVYGLKGEYIQPYSNAYILGIEKKTVVGLAQTRIDGAKCDDIGGAKIDNLLGMKYERKGEEDKSGASPAFRNEGIANDKMTSLKVKIGNAMSKWADWLYKVKENSAEIGKLTTDIADVTKAIKDAQEAGTKYQAKLDAYKETCSSNAQFKASEISYDCAGFQVYGSGTASYLNMAPDSQCILKGGGGTVTCGPSKVCLSGPKHILGKSF